MVVPPAVWEPKVLVRVPASTMVEQLDSLPAASLAEIQKAKAELASRPVRELVSEGVLATSREGIQLEPRHWKTR